VLVDHDDHHAHRRGGEQFLRELGRHRRIVVLGRAVVFAADERDVRCRYAFRRHERTHGNVGRDDIGSGQRRQGNQRSHKRDQGKRVLHRQPRMVRQCGRNIPREPT